jgi:hypothetical protein
MAIPTNWGTEAGAHEMTALNDPKWKDACAVIGEVTLLYTSLDHQLNHIIIEVMHLIHSTMLEAVVATLDTRQKIEILKSRGKQIREKDWKKAVLTHADRLERVARIRNAVCHTPLIPMRGKDGFEFAPAAASKILKSITIVEKSYTLDRLTLEVVREVVPLAEKALGGGEQLIENFAKVRQVLLERAKRAEK